MQTVKCNITEVTTGIIVHSVNCMGVMGSGVAAALRYKWPQIFNNYKQMCTVHEHSRGRLLGQVDFVDVGENLVVANVFGQEYFGRDGKTYANPISLLQGLTTVFLFAEQHNLPIHSVKLGSGLGGLNWYHDVRPLFDQLESKHPLIPLTIYEL